MSSTCEGCSRNGQGTNLECSVYGIPPSYYLRVGQCPFNIKVVEKKKDFVRVGQQKQKKKSRGK